MLAPDVMIVQVPLNLPTRKAERGDRYDQREFGLNDQIDAAMRFTRHIVPLTRESYRNAMLTRPNGSVGHGFTPEELLEAGILEEGDLKAIEKAARKALEDSQEVYRGYTILTFPSGNLSFFEVRDPAGALMRPKRFRAVAAAKAFIDDLPAIEAPDTSKGEEESDHGGDLQSGADGTA